MASYLLGDNYDKSVTVLDYELAYANAERLTESLDEIIDCIEKRADDITLMEISDDCPKPRFENIVKAYFKDLSLEKFLTTNFTEDWFSEFEDECYFNIDFIDRIHVLRASCKLGVLVASYWL